MNGWSDWNWLLFGIWIGIFLGAAVGAEWRLWKWKRKQRDHER
jgi:hypothetical protein